MDENKSNENKNKKAWLVRATTSIRANFLSILQEKTYFFLFYTSTFTKDPHQFIYSTHLFNKIFILFTFFIISFPLEQTHKLVFSVKPHPHTTNHPSTKSFNKIRRATPTPSQPPSSPSSYKPNTNPKSPIPSHQQPSTIK